MVSSSSIDLSLIAPTMPSLRGLPDIHSGPVAFPYLQVPSTNLHLALAIGASSSALTPKSPYAASRLPGIRYRFWPQSWCIWISLMITPRSHIGLWKAMEPWPRMSAEYLKEKPYSRDFIRRNQPLFNQLNGRPESTSP